MYAVWLIHAAASLMMAGVIWFVQIVHYPLMAKVGAAGFPAYERAHTRLTGWVVAPLMLAEAVTAVALLWLAPDPARITAWCGFALVVLIWLSTWTVQVPKHRLLTQRFDVRTHAALVSTNWVRTIAWSGRALLALWMLRFAA